MAKAPRFHRSGLLVAVGYMDPGNWATDLAGGARFGYLLMSVILISNGMAILLQHLSLKLGIATGRDLAQACREYYPRKVALSLWLLCEIGIAACDLAEVIGSAVALQLLFGLPVFAGVLAPPSPSMGPEADHPALCDRTGGPRRCYLRRGGHRRASHSQPGNTFVTTELCYLSLD
jgi:hypothetical protein